MAIGVHLYKHQAVYCGAVGVGVAALIPEALDSQEDREWALRKGLEEINREIEAASRSGVACWFPMGTRNERIVRLAAKEAQLLNSRCAARGGQHATKSQPQIGKRLSYPPSFMPAWGCELRSALRSILGPLDTG